MNRNNNRFKIKLTFTIFSFAMVPIIFLISFIFNNIYNQRKDAFFAEYQSAATKYVSIIDNNISKSIQNLFYTAAIPELYQYLNRKWSSDMIDTLDFYEDLRRTLHAIYKTSGYYNVIKIYTDDPEIFKGDIIKSMDTLDEKERTYIEENTSKQYQCIAYLTEDGQYLKHYKTISSPSGRLAIIESSLRLSSLLEGVNYFEKDLAIMVYNGNYDKYTSLHPIENGTNNRTVYLTQGRELIEMQSRDAFPIVFSFSTYILQKSAKEIAVYAAALVFLSAVVLLVVIQIITNLLTKKLYQLTDSIKIEGKQISWDSQLTSKHMDEFTSVEEAFRNLVDKLNIHLEEENRLRMENQRLELDLLQYLFNPHFLYNTLSAIKITSHDKGLGRIIDSLVHYYRITLSRGKSIIPIYEEVEMIREYINIQRFSYDMDFEFICNVDDKIEDSIIQKLTLQPFVENAIFHGISNMKGGKIWLNIEKENDCIAISIIDNGVGMTEEQLKSIAEGTSKGGYNGYGAVNSINRLKMFFQDQCEICIKSKINEGTCVELIIPNMTDEKLKEI